MSLPSNRANRTKKIFAALIVPMFLLSILVVLTTSAAGGAAVASTAGGLAPPVSSPYSLALNPTTFGFSSADGIVIATPTLVTASTFTSGATVLFCISATTSFSVSSAQVGSYALPAGTTTMSNVAVEFAGSATVHGIVTAVGTYYIAATDGAACEGSTTGYTAPVKVTVATPPTLTLDPTTGTPGSTVAVTGTGWGDGSTVSLTEAAPLGTLVATFTAGSSTSTTPGAISGTFTLPQLPAGSETFWAQNTTAPGGITVNATYLVTPSITVSPGFYNGAASTQLKVTGVGFAAGALIKGNTINITSAASGTHNETGTTSSSQTVSSTGQFTVTVTTSTTIPATSTIGPANVQVPAYTPSSTYVGINSRDAVFISTPNPTALGFTFSVATANGTDGNYPGLAGVTATVYNFPAATTVDFYLGPAIIGTATTSSLGYAALPSTTMVPAMPAGSYTPYAVAPSQNLYVYNSTTQAVNSYFVAVDPTGADIVAAHGQGEYIPSDGLITIKGYGLTPATAYPFTDTLGGSNAAFVSVSVGSMNATGTGGIPAANGTLIFDYMPNYLTSVTTGTSSIVYLGTHASPIVGALGVQNYSAIGAPAFTEVTASYASAWQTGTTAYLNVTNLISAGAMIFYPGITNSYNVFLSSTELSNSTGSAFSAPSGTAYIKGFTVPALASGLYKFSVSYAGTGLAAAIGVSHQVVVSTPGTSLSSGALYLATTGQFVAWGLEPGANVALWATTSSGLANETGLGKILTGTLTIPATGALTTANFTGLYSTPTLPAGSYSAFLVLAKGTSTSSSVATTVTIVANLTLSAYAGSVGASLSISTAGGLVAGQYYDVYFASTYEITAHATASNAITGNFAVPSVLPGTYAVSLDLTGTTTVAATAMFTVTGSTTITLTGVDPAGVTTAFPTELVQFSWTPSTTPVGPGAAAPNYYGPIEVTAYLNGTAFTTFPAAGLASSGSVAAPGVAVTTIEGSLVMPNDPAGTYWFVTFSWTQSTSTSTSALVEQPFTDSTPTTESTPSTSTSTFSPAGASQTLALWGVSTGATTLSLTPEANFNGVVTTCTAATIAANGAVPLSGCSAGVTNAVLDISGLSLAADGATTGSTVTYVFEGDYLGLPFSTTAQTQVIGAETTAGTYGSLLGLTGSWTTSGSTTTTTIASYTEPSSAALQLVSGNGALLTGISPGQIAEITAAVNSSVTTSMKVPLSELNASIVSINGLVAKITTAFGTMNATLSAINASVASVSGTVAKIETSVGAITVSLSAIDATLASVNGTVAKIETSVGAITVSLSAINATVTSINSGIATIQTSLGTLSGQVTSIGNGLVTVQTSIGNLTAQVGKIPTVNTSGQVNTAVYLLYAAIALIIITLALAAVLLVRGGGGQGGRPPKAYEGPSSSGGSGGGGTGGA